MDPPVVASAPHRGHGSDFIASGLCRVDLLGAQRGIDPTGPVHITLFASVHPDVETALEAWYCRVKNARWHDFAEIRADYPSADQVGSLAVFDSGGNQFRMVVVRFKAGKVYVPAILPHAEYDRGHWKADQPKPKCKTRKKPKEDS
jgi:mRNA interferase HigB